MLMADLATDVDGRQRTEPLVKVIKPGGQQRTKSTYHNHRIHKVNLNRRFEGIRR